MNIILGFRVSKRLCVTLSILAGHRRSFWFYLLLLHWNFTTPAIRDTDRSTVGAWRVSVRGSDSSTELILWRNKCWTTPLLLCGTFSSVRRVSQALWGLEQCVWTQKLVRRGSERGVEAGVEQNLTARSFSCALWSAASMRAGAAELRVLPPTEIRNYFRNHW